MVAADADELTPPSLQLAAFERVGQPKKLLLLEGCKHYARYTERFAESSRAARDWFVQHL